VKDRRSPPRRVLHVLALLAAIGSALPGAATAGAAFEKADRVLVLKSERRLVLLRQGEILASFPIALGGDPTGPKLREGDKRTPEGVYAIDGRNPQSPYHLSLHLSYPGPRDVARARTIGAAPGGDIAIHGMPNRYGRFDPVRFYKDWTDGCIAVGNLAIEEIWRRVEDGTPVEIRP
jgi:murein L,D-transpeptidase YafK